MRLAIGAAFAGLAMLALSAVVAERAAAEPGICAEYAGLPQCEAADPADGGSGGDGDVVGTGAGGGTDSGIPAAAGPSAADLGGAGGAGGSLPFTGYPLSPLVLILLVLLAAGLAIRAGLAVRSRMRSRAAA